MKTYYQPLYYFNAGTDNEYAIVPDGLWDFQAFATVEEADAWLKAACYEPTEYDIHEYHDDDIEDVVIIDREGNVVGDTYEIVYGNICNFLAAYDSRDDYSASDLMMWGKDVIEQVKTHWNEIRSNK